MEPKTYVSLEELYELYVADGTKPPDWLSRMLGRRKLEGEELYQAAIEAGIPSMFAVAEPTTEHLDVLRGGGGLYVCGTQGAGKTWLASRITKGWLAEGRGARFVSSVALLAEIGDAYGSRTEGESKVLARYSGYPLLVVDDLGKEVPSQWVMSRLFEILNARYADRKATIVTTQFSLTDLAKRMAQSGDAETAMAIVSRFKEKYRLVNLGNVDRRAM